MAGRRAEMANTEDGEKLIKKDKIAGAEISIYNSQIKTVNDVDRLKKKDVFTIYKHVTGDERPEADFFAAQDVVKGEVQFRWYEARSIPVPPRVIKNQEDRVAKAKKATMNDESVAKRAKAAKKAGKKVKETAAVAAKGKKINPVTETKEGGKTSKKAIIRHYITQGLEADAILERLNKELPDGKHVRGNIVFQRNQMIKEGELSA
jgi:hypothetical protein